MVRSSVLLKAAVMLVACGFSHAAAADRWAFRNADGEIKFGYVESGSSNFDTLYFECDATSREIRVSAAAGNRRPKSGRATATVRAASRTASIAGPVSEFDFDGVYALETTLPRDHPVFDLLATGAAVSYAAPGWTRPKLTTAGQKDAVAKFLAACR
jgi:hypothetical protein